MAWHTSISAYFSSQTQSTPQAIPPADSPVLKSQLFKRFGALNRIEQGMWGSLAIVVFILIAIDIKTDIQSHSSLLHITFDALLGCLSMLGILFLWQHFGAARLDSQDTIRRAQQDQSFALDVANQWRSEAKRIQQGLTQEIEKQFQNWRLTTAEQEVALLLLKGLSIREVSQVRGTAEKTVRHQSLGIYAKAGVTGRAELSAFFLEEFLDTSHLSVQSGLRSMASSDDGMGPLAHSEH